MGDRTTVALSPRAKSDPRTFDEALRKNGIRSGDLRAWIVERVQELYADETALNDGSEDRYFWMPPSGGYVAVGRYRGWEIADRLGGAPWAREVIVRRRSLRLLRHAGWGDQHWESVPFPAGVADRVV